MKNLIVFLLLLSFYGCMGIISPKIDQKIDKVLCYDKELSTLVWYKGDIVWSKYDELENLTDSIVEFRYNEAMDFKSTLKKVNKKPSNKIIQDSTLYEAGYHDGWIDALSIKYITYVDTIVYIEIESH